MFGTKRLKMRDDAFWSLSPPPPPPGPGGGGGRKTCSRAGICARRQDMLTRWHMRKTPRHAYVQSSRVFRRLLLKAFTQLVAYLHASQKKRADLRRELQSLRKPNLPQGRQGGGECAAESKLFTEYACFAPCVLIQKFKSELELLKSEL